MLDNIEECPFLNTTYSSTKSYYYIDAVGRKHTVKNAKLKATTHPYKDECIDEEAKVPKSKFVAMDRLNTT